MDQGRGSIHREKNLSTEIHILVVCRTRHNIQSHASLQAFLPLEMCSGVLVLYIFTTTIYMAKASKAGNHPQDTLIHIQSPFVFPYSHETDYLCN